MPLLRRAIGTVLRRIRLGQGRTLRDVARAAGVSLPYLSELERGRKETSSEILASICRALGLTLADLLDEVRHEVRRLEAEPSPDLSVATPGCRRHVVRCTVASGRGHRRAGVLRTADSSGAPNRSDRGRAVAGWW